MAQRDLLPSAFRAPITAKILKTAPALLAELTAAGRIAAIPGQGGWTRYSREELEKILDRPLTIEEWAEAERAHDRRRAANQRYNRKRRTSPTKGAA
jgi:hypothetical protein